MRPTIVDLTVHPSGMIQVEARTNLEALIAGIGPDHSDTTHSPQAEAYEQLRGQAPEALRAAFMPLASEFLTWLNLSVDGEDVPLSLSQVDIPEIGDTDLARTSRLVLQGAALERAETVTWHVDASLGSTVVRISRAGEEKPFFSALLGIGEATPPVPLRAVRGETKSASFIEFLLIGFQHIVPEGLDHILFIVSLFLLSPRLRPLLAQSVSFTLAHSATLALGTYGVVGVPAGIVEPLIAITIVFVAVENLITDRLRRWRPAMVFGFGLLHGLGFAGVLKEVGLPADQFLIGLLAFNFGVELGQIAVILACMLAVGVWFRDHSYYRHAISMPASAAIAVIGIVWFFERIA
jgi:hydrogenase/urease accessory protein HupE